MKKWLFNPFVYVAGAKALLLGWTAMLLTAAIAYYSKAHYDGVLDLHVGKVNIVAGLAEQLTVWGCTVSVFYLCGSIFSRSAIRLIDVAGTLALARWPMVFTALISFGIKPMPKQYATVQELMNYIDAQFLLLSLSLVVFVVWMVALTYNAVCVSCNMKGSKAAVVFTIGLLVAEVLSKLILILIYNYTN